MTGLTRLTRRLILAALTCACGVVGTSTAFAQQSWGIAVDASGAIYFCDRARTTVWRLSSDGHLTAAMTGVTCRAIVSGPDGTVYGESIPGDVTTVIGVGLWQIDAAGTRQWLVTPTTRPAPGTWLARDANGLQYSWTGNGAGSPRSEIVQRDPSGAIFPFAGDQWGQRDGFGRTAAFGNVAGLAVAPDGSVVVADSGNIRRVSVASNVQTEAAGVVTDSHLGLINMPGLWGRELGVATDPSGAAVVVDPQAGHVVHVDRTGRVTPIWEPAGFPQRISGGRWGWRPMGVAMMDSSYYVLDEWMGPAVIADLIGSPRLSHVDREGRVTRIATISEWSVRAAAAALLIVALSAVWVQWSRRRAANRA